MIVVGLTGGIASGKSLVAEYLQELGIPVIDTDIVARQVVAPGQPAWRRLCEVFGPDYFTPEGALDRNAMAKRVFADPEARRTLEAITHPAIFAEVDCQLAHLRQQPSPPPLVVVVVPLLFEVGAESRFDTTIIVCAPREQQLERLRRTRGLSHADAEARIAAQMPLSEKLSRAEYRLDNSTTPDALRHQVRRLLHKILHRPA